MPFFSNGQDILHNAQLRIYPDNTIKITVCDRAIYKEIGWEKRQPNICSVESARADCEEREGDSPGDNVAKAIRRAKNKIFDIALCNDWEWFATLTFDDKNNRYDNKQISKAVKTWCRNMVNRHNLKYILVPELHKDGAIHLHGLISGDVGASKAFTPNNKPIFQNRKRVYNIGRWSGGFSTATKVKDNLAVSKYITKYITKDITKIFGNYYYAGGTIRRAPNIVLTDVDFSEYVAENNLKVYLCKETGLRFAYNESKEKI